jgi:hypothetical protein
MILLASDLALINGLVSALHVHAVADVREGRRPEIVAVARRGVRVLPVVAAATIMSWLGITLGFVLLVVPGVILLFRWAVVALDHDALGARPFLVDLVLHVVTASFAALATALLYYDLVAREELELMPAGGGRNRA